MEYTKEDLMEAKRQIDSTLHKLRETYKTPLNYCLSLCLSIYIKHIKSAFASLWLYVFSI